MGLVECQVILTGRADTKQTFGSIIPPDGYVWDFFSMFDLYSIFNVANKRLIYDDL